MSDRCFSQRLFLVGMLAVMGLCPPSYAAERVILISIDGLRSDAVTTQGEAVLPNFYRIRSEGAFTDNARTDYDLTVTLPNHTSMMTSRGVLGPEGHNWTDNGTPTQTIHENKGSYVASMFDVAHDAGLSTALVASKSKFSLFNDSYDADSGAPHPNGADKIDYYFETNYGSGVDETAQPAANQFINDLNAHTRQLSMLHILDLDSVGHAAGWMSAPYLAAVANVDAMIGQVLNYVETDPDYAGKTTVILTADHGGTGTGHSNAALAVDYTIPFYVWGEGVSRGADLYTANLGRRIDPGVGRPSYSGPQPVRNGDAGNLALSLLGLDAIPGSTINVDQSLRIALVGDLNRDGFVGIADLNIILSNWNMPVTQGDEAAGDLSWDGYIGIADLNLLLSKWNNGTPPIESSEIPEPASLLILGMLFAARFAGRR